MSGVSSFTMSAPVSKWSLKRKLSLALSLFWNVMQRWLAVSYRFFWTPKRIQVSSTASALKMGQIGWAETSVTVTKRCATSQKGEHFIHTAAEVTSREARKENEGKAAHILNRRARDPSCTVFNVTLPFTRYHIVGIARLATDWTVRESNPGGGQVSRTHAGRPSAPPCLLCSGHRISFPVVKWALTTHPHLTPRLKKK